MNLTDNKYGESKETAEVIHYLDPKISYTMKKERVTEPKDNNPFSILQVYQH